MSAATKPTAEALEQAQSHLVSGDAIGVSPGHESVDPTIHKSIQLNESLAFDPVELIDVTREAYRDALTAGQQAHADEIAKSMTDLIDACAKRIGHILANETP